MMDEYNTVLKKVVPKLNLAVLSTAIIAIVKYRVQPAIAGYLAYSIRITRVPIDIR